MINIHAYDDVTYDMDLKNNNLNGISYMFILCLLSLVYCVDFIMCSFSYFYSHSVSVYVSFWVI